MGQTLSNQAEILTLTQSGITDDSVKLSAFYHIDFWSEMVSDIGVVEKYSVID